MKNETASPSRKATLEGSDFQNPDGAPIEPTAPALKNGRSEAVGKATLEPSNFQFEEQDWTRFLYASTLPQMAGVPARHLRRLALKELTDNALDAGEQTQTKVSTGPINRRGDWFFVEDNGDGIDPDAVPVLFSVNRPYMSTKLWRRPMRGASGNGLRVVAGVVAASGGSCRVYTKDRVLVLRPRRSDGKTAYRSFPAEPRIGTRVEIRFGEGVPADEDTLVWAKWACALASGPIYDGATSPHWYDGETFYRLLQAAGPQPVRQFIEQLKGCSGAKAGRIASGFLNVPCNKMSPGQAIRLLEVAKAQAQPVKPDKLGAVGPLPWFRDAYAVKYGEFPHGAQKPQATVPYVVEAWADVERFGDDDAELTVLVNKTPIAGEVHAYKEKSQVQLYGCGLSCEVKGPAGFLNIAVNVITPYCPITTTGKQPDLKVFSDTIGKAVTAAVNKAKKRMPKTDDGEDQNFKSIILANLNDAIADASSGGKYRFGQRQLYYKIRPHVPDGLELRYARFTEVITEYENEFGLIHGMVREPRGSLYHPHTGETIYLGTLAAEKYQRPPHSFNKLFYIEKEGVFEALKAIKWPERYDCALASAKGYTNRAIKDIFDGFADDGEPITIFCVHDADAEGSMIYQTLVEETKARPKRRVEVINLGMEPWEAIALRLPVEERGTPKKRRAVADYIINRRRDGHYWQHWLQSKRVELDALTTEEFIAWLTGEMLKHDTGKVLPPESLAVEELEQRLDVRLRETITERVLLEANIDALMERARARIIVPTGSTIVAEIEEWLPANETESWRDYVDDLARERVEASTDQRDVS